MFKAAVLLIVTFVLVVSFQNCGTTVPAGAAMANANVAASSTYETPLVNVREIAKANPSDPTRLVLDGYFRSGCPATVEPVVESNGTIHTVHAVVTSQNSNDISCSMALVPFEAPVTLAELATGAHTVRFDSEDGPKEIVIQVD